MVWEYSFDGGRNILEVKVKGDLTKPELDAMAKENLVEIRKLDCYKCLLNYSETEKGLSVLDAYERPKATTENGMDFGAFTARDAAIAFLMK